TILVVDDEPDVRQGMIRWFGGMGYTVLEASSGEEAVGMIRERAAAVHLVVLDMVMKGMGGGQAFRRLREIAPKLPIIICTGYPPNGDSRRILEREADDSILKPFGFNELAVKIRAILDRPPLQI
ncbi:MAG: response regulator, partial [Candidatus Aureabacteria bacterium]|nr:response regulator [Candidatus Auribacterota bacterium]